MDDRLKETKKIIAKHHGIKLFNELKSYQGFNDWVKNNNEYQSDANLIKQHFISQINFCLTEFILEIQKNNINLISGKDEH